MKGSLTQKSLLTSDISTFDVCPNTDVVLGDVKITSEK